MKYLKIFQWYFLRFRSIGGISHTDIDFDAIKKVENLKHIVFKKFSYCSLALDFHVEVCRPKTDGEADCFVLMLLWSISLPPQLRSLLEYGSLNKQDVKIFRLADVLFDLCWKRNGLVGEIHIARREPFG